MNGKVKIEGRSIPCQIYISGRIIKILSRRPLAILLSRPYNFEQQEKAVLGNSSVSIKQERTGNCIIVQAYIQGGIFIYDGLIK